MLQTSDTQALDAATDEQVSQQQQTEEMEMEQLETKVKRHEDKTPHQPEHSEIEKLLPDLLKNRKNKRATNLDEELEAEPQVSLSYM